MRGKSFLLIPCLLLIMLSGCATTSEMDSLKNDISNIKSELATQRKNSAEISTSLGAVSQDVTALKERTEGVVKEYAFTAIRESQSSLLTQTSDLSKELQTMKGRFDENKYFIDKAIKELLAEKELQQAKITGLENELKALKTREPVAVVKEGAPEKNGTGSAEKTPVPPASPEAKPEDSGPMDPQRLYDEAQIDFREKRYPEARQKFEKFVKDFQKHALTPNSYYWTGESLFAEKKYEDAILAYETFLKKFPDNDKVKGAMLKQAYSFIDMGDRKTGKVILERVIEKYPTSKEAELAEKKIAEVLAKGPIKTKKKKKK